MSTALAQSPAPPVASAPLEHDYDLSLTVGPVLGATLAGAQDRGVLPMAELMFESRQGKAGGIGLIGGFGHVDDATAWELGLGGRGYVVGDFDFGMILGAEAVFFHQGERPGNPAESGLSFGPVLGAKYVAPFGLTVDVTAGASAMFYGTGFDTAQQGWGPIVNTQIGWSL